MFALCSLGAGTNRSPQLQRTIQGSRRGFKVEVIIVFSLGLGSGLGECVCVCA